MSILSFFKKREQASSSKEIEVVLRTDKNLSEEQKNTIIALVKECILSGEEPSDIGILIMMKTGIFEPVVITQHKNSVEVII